MTGEKKYSSSTLLLRVGRRKVNPEILLDRARRLRRKTKDHPITDNELHTAKQMGRA
jgi:hypothetical protein